MADAPAKQSYSTDPALYIYTSLTAGSSHIVTATSRLETILKANRVPFKALDLATDEKARMLWGRRAGKDEGGRPRKLPALVQMGLVLGDLVEIEDWNEYGELKQHVKIYYDEFTIPPKGAAQIANPLRPIYGKPATTLAASSTGPKAAPPAPLLPNKAELEAKKKELDAKRAAEPKTSAPAATPTKSIAEEAAQKAKQVRLDSLRAQVQKDKEAAALRESAEAEKKAADTTPAAAAAAADAAAADTAPSKESSANASASGLTISPAPKSEETKAAAAGLQSPTSGAWKTTSQEDSLRNVLQSPTSGTWKSGETSFSLPVREHRGSSIVEASKEEIAAIEKATAIPEEAVEDEDEEEEDSSDEEEEKAEKK